MVLQREIAAPVWGWAEPGEEVTVILGAARKATAADPDGRWIVKLDPLKTAEPQTLIVKGKNTLTIQDVLIGEVWLCSGQSNMELKVSSAKDFAQEKAAANLPGIRMFTVERNSQPEPQVDFRGKWEVCSPATIHNFSATAFFYGRRLHQELGVPVGLINSSWGGTPIEAWTSLDAQQALPEYATIEARTKKLTAQLWDEAKAATAYAEREAAWKVAAEAARAQGQRPKAPPIRPIDPRLDQHHPANLFNGMIAPLIPYGLRGGIWYQGETNAEGGIAPLYGRQLTTLIQDWRHRWGSEFPFAWVQLPEFFAPQKTPSETTGWVLVREGMLKALSLPRTGMVVTLGLGSATTIHPKNKQDVGARLATWALADVYEKRGVVGFGPLPAGQAIRGAEITVSFTHTDGGLVAKDGDLKGFAIAGEDRKWVRASAKIEDGKVIVSSMEVPNPVAVRYAWASNPEFNLYNGAGLPASPFRTDDWEDKLVPLRSTTGKPDENL